MKLKIEIELDNAAFENDPQAEIVKILKDACLLIEGHHIPGVNGSKLFDTNGNKVGVVTVED